MSDKVNSTYNPLNPTTPTASESLHHHHRFSECADPNSPHHTLDCGHVVLIPLLSTTTCTTPPTTNPLTSTPVPKFAHAPNCLRLITLLKPSLPLSWLKNTLPAPFVCPQCVEICVRCDYDSFAYQDPGSVRRGRETNVELWTYEAVLSMVEDGGRMCEGMWGVFRMGEVGAYRAMGGSDGGEARQRAEGFVGVEKWEIRDPVADGVGQDENEDGRVIDAEDASRVAVLKARYHNQAMKQQDEMDELAERLGDAKVGELGGDMDVEELLKSLEGLRACE